MGLEINGVNPAYGKKGQIFEDGVQEPENKSVTVPIGKPTQQKGIDDAANKTNFGIPGLTVDYSARYQQIADEAKATLDSVTNAPKDGANTADNENKKFTVNLNYEGDDVLLKEQRRTKENFKDLQAQYEKDINQYGAIVDDEGTVKYVLTKKERKELNKSLKDNGVKKEKRNEILSDIFLTEKEAKKAAKQMAKNEQRKEEFEGTRTYADKAEYKQAEKARKAERKELVKQYRDQGLSRREAKEAADNVLVKNIYASKATRKNKEFRDENGNFSNMKLKESALRRANIGNQGDAVEDYRVSLKERRANAQLDGVTTHKEGHYTKDAGMSTEYNHTTQIRGGVIGGSAAAGYLAGHILGDIIITSESTSASTAGAVAGDAAAGAASGAAADAAAEASVYISGELIGGAAGTVTGLAAAPFLSDHGEKIKHNYAINKPQQHEKPPVVEEQPPVVEEQPQQPVVDQTPQVQPQPEPCFEDICDYETDADGKTGWQSIVAATYRIDGKPIDAKMQKAVAHGLKLKHGITDFKLNTIPTKQVEVNGKKKTVIAVRLHTNFSDILTPENIRKHPELQQLQGVQFELDCNGKTQPGNGRGKPTKFIRWTGSYTDALPCVK